MTTLASCVTAAIVLPDVRRWGDEMQDYAGILCIDYGFLVGDLRPGETCVTLREIHLRNLWSGPDGLQHT